MQARMLWAALAFCHVTAGAVQVPAGVVARQDAHREGGNAGKNQV